MAKIKALSTLGLRAALKIDRPPNDVLDRDLRGPF